MDETKIIRPGLCCPVSKQVPTIKAKLRGKVKQLNDREIKRFKNQYAILKELFEDGYVESARFLENILVQERDLQSRCPDGIRQKLLRESPDLLYWLVDCLKKTENINESDYPKVEKLLNIGISLFSDIPDYKWITKDVLNHSLAKAKFCKSEQLQAKCLFYLGKLYASYNCFKEANEKFKDALLLAQDKQWVLNKRDDNRFVSIALCLEYYQTLLIECEQFIGIREKLNESMENAIKIATLTKNAMAIAVAYNTIAVILHRIKDFDKALKLYHVALVNYRLTGDLHKICQIELEIAKCSIDLENFPDAKIHIDRSALLARKNNFQHELAIGHVFMGHIERYCANTELAIQSYTSAIEIFSSLRNEKEMRSVRCYAALSLAQKIIKPLIELTKRSNDAEFGNNSCMMKLIKWQESREPFWTEK